MSTSRKTLRVYRDCFTAYVYEEDLCKIQKLVQPYADIETGGDLFGLWQDEKTVIIQRFIGPGKECERTAASFHQDVEYLRKVGTLFTTEEGLCNVGNGIHIIKWECLNQAMVIEPQCSVTCLILGWSGLCFSLRPSRKLAIVERKDRRT